VVLLAESHLAVHTWPELGAATLDVYVCNLGADNSARAERLLAVLVDAFAPASVERHALERGRAPVQVA
jgi:S-adenosylmethionine/arginine decarboxylase-like enzyme